MDHRSWIYCLHTHTHIHTHTHTHTQTHTHTHTHTHRQSKRERGKDHENKISTDLLNKTLTLFLDFRAAVTVHLEVCLKRLMLLQETLSTHNSSVRIDWMSRCYTRHRLYLVSSSVEADRNKDCICAKKCACRLYQT